MRFETSTVDLSSGAITYHTAGEGRPVLYLHAAGGFRLTRPLEQLAEGFRVYAPVTPGFDGTPAHDGVGTMPDLAKLMGDFADTVIGERCDVIGHSFGGWLACWFAVLQPDKLDQLVLEAPAGFRPEGVGGLSDNPEELRRRLYAHPENLPSETKPPEMQARNREMLHHYHGPAAMDQELVQRLGDIQSLTLILYGTKDGAIPIESPRLLKQKIPRSFLIYVYDAAHNVEVDQPERFSDLVGDFLARGEAFLVNNSAQAAAE